MILAETLPELQTGLSSLGDGSIIGFVPTMGALHEGHLSLVRKAIQETEIVVVSIFVNPTQFNDPKDLERYPRTLSADLKLVENTGCHIVFAPSVKEIYPVPDTRIFGFGDLEVVMEGKFRPGHFNGVAQVVSRLFEIVKPQKAYFGQKDFQQLAIVKNMVMQLQLPVEIIPCPIVRETNGLAMSSRNELLSVEERENASAISRALSEARELKLKYSVSEVAEIIKANINNNRFLQVEYVDIVDDTTLQPVKSWDDPCGKVVCTAVFCGKVRLIDNVVLN